MVLFGGLVTLSPAPTALGPDEFGQVAPQGTATTPQGDRLRPGTGEASTEPAMLLLPAPDNLDEEAGQWVYVSDLSLSRATTGWTAVANVGLPQRDLNFREHQITFLENGYEKGLGTYPFSEIEVSLQQRYRVFRADLGVDDEAEAGNGSVVFRVFLDDVEVYRSGTLRGGDFPSQVNLSVSGANTMRLVVTDAGDGSLNDYADWADAKLFLPDDPPADEEVDANLAILDQVRQEQESTRSVEKEELEASSAAARDLVTRAVGEPAEASASEGVVLAHDRESSSLVFANRYLAIIFGFGGAGHGYLSVFDRRNDQLVLKDAVATLEVDGRGIDLHADTRPLHSTSFTANQAEDIGLGRGKVLQVNLAGRGSDQVSVAFALYDESPAFTYRFFLYGTLAQAKSITYRFFDQNGNPALLPGAGDMEYITDQSRARLGRIVDDGLRRQETTGYGKPVFVWDDAEPRGLVMALLDPTTAQPRVSFLLPKGRALVFLDYAVQDSSSPPAAGGMRRSPRLLVDVTNTSDTRYAFADFKQVSQTVYPPLALPDWVRYQWLSWYVYYMDINEKVIRDQIDFIAENLSDLGPWHIIVDAGWYIAEGRPDADWKNVDREKFPSGLRELVDYAHARGVKVVLYFSAPYLNDKEEAMNWLGLRGIIDQHPDWLIPFSDEGGFRSFVYDFDNPSFRAYLTSVMRDYFVTYDVDGIKIDGLGNAEGEIMSAIEQDVVGEANKLEVPTLPIYQFIHDTAVGLKDDVYFESGWSTPQFAQAYANTFRYGDEQSSFDFPYPFCGLRQHVDYAILQNTVLGQRSNMGAIRGHPDEDYLGIWWLGAALALGTQVSLSFDFTTISPESLSLYRSLLRDYEPFVGQTYFGDTLFADSFATTKNGLTYLGVINRGDEDKNYVLPLEDYGLDNQRSYAVFDVYSNSYYTAQGAIEATLGGQEFKLFVLRETPGLMWSNSSVSAAVDEERSTITLDVAGPGGIPGFVDVYAPGVQSVSVDGEPRSRAGEASESEDEYAEYAYDVNSGIVTIRYLHDTPHTIQIGY